MPKIRKIPQIYYSITNFFKRERYREVAEHKHLNLILIIKNKKIRNLKIFFKPTNKQKLIKMNNYKFTRFKNKTCKNNTKMNQIKK